MAEEIKIVNISDEMERSFLEYSMSVIVARALPDVRDGLKPVHRRILYAMSGLGLTPEKQYKKSVRVVGEVLGKYHPHGDTAVYESMVRMAQSFSERYELVDGHGNFGSIDGDSAAAMRYTEVKMSKISVELLRDLNKNTVNFVDNFDGTEREPEVLPSKFPNILVNGTTGIAVGMATNIPPHNLGEVIDGVIAISYNPELTPFELMDYIKGPDFPTGATIMGNSGIKKGYETGKGIITVRSKCIIEEIDKGKQRIIVTEIPYQTNKARLVERIAQLVRDKQLDGISDLRDETNREGIRVVIEIRRDSNANVVLNNLYKHTYLQTSYGINLLALVDGEPKLLKLNEILNLYLDHQKVIVYRRTKFDLEKAENRAHILEGLQIALDNIDEVVKTIRAAKNDEDALNSLMSKFKLTEIQAKAILDMRLRRLTGLEREKIDEEIKNLFILIEELKGLLADENKVLEIIRGELLEIKERFNDERRTVIDMNSIAFIEDESLIPVDEIVITITKNGYVKRVQSDVYRTQNRGGVGVKGMSTNEEDFVEKIIYATSHSYILFFTNKGKVYKLKGYEIPEYSRQAKGIPVVNVIPIEKDESVTSIVKIDNFEDKGYLFFGTSNGIVKKTNIEEFQSVRTNGKIAISLRGEDELISVKLAVDNDEIALASSNGKLVRFNQNEIRSMGRSAAGVIGIKYDSGECVGLEVIKPDQEILVITENGYGKRTNVNEYRLTHRGSKGVKTLNITDKNGKIVAFKVVSGDEDLFISTNTGMLIRVPVEQIAQTGRSTQGVKLINLKEDNKVTTVALVPKEELEEIEEE